MNRSFLSALWDRLGGGAEIANPGPSERFRLSGKALRVPFRGLPLEVEMGRQRLQIYPDLALDVGCRKSPPDFLLFDPERYLTGHGHFLRLEHGQRVAIRQDAQDQRPLFSFPREAFRRRLKVRHEGDALVFSDPVTELGTYLSVLADEEDVHRLLARRRRSLVRVAEVFGGPLEPLPTEEALAVLGQVNRLMNTAPHRPKDADGNPGGLIELPAGLTPVVLGDLHARVDNLLKTLSENGLLESLERGDAALVVLGDAVHPEADGKLEEMDSSVLMMDLLFKLMLRFPDQIFFVLGNHDSFSSEVMKHGVPQGLLWRRRLWELRGDEYVEGMELFYRRSPLVVLSQHFIGCHAGPPRARVSRETLVDVRRFPGMVHELTWTRARTHAFPAGYGRTDVRRFRKALGRDPETPFIVAHQPVSDDGAVWLNARQIPGHHVVFSSRPDRAGLITWIEGELVPHVYRTEPLLGWLNERAGTHGG